MTARCARGPPLAELERVLEETCGLTLSAGIRRTLLDAFLRAARELRLGQEPFLGRLRAREPRAVTALIEAAVVGETYFFRHPEQLFAVRELVLKSAPRDRPLSIWSAGCATGEEPYSLAMELLDAGRSGSGDLILATDVSSRALKVAREGRYGEWSLRRLDPSVRLRHFEACPPQVLVRPHVRALVDFRRHNLVSDPAPATLLDLILCRNVLIYFNPPTAARVVEKLLLSLAPGGVLVLGPVEAPFAAGRDLERLEENGATIFRVPGGRPLPFSKPVERGERVRGERAREALRLVLPSGEEAPRRPAAPSGGEFAPPPAPPEAAERPGLEAAREAARRGDLSAAEELARTAASGLCPEAWLLVSMAKDARGDLAGAVDAVRRALYLDPGLALGHAALIPLYERLGRPREAARARRNALEALSGLDDAAPLRGVETVTAGALRSALVTRHRSAPRQGALLGSQG